MKNLSELTDFYYKVLFVALKQLEKDRKQLQSRIIVVGVLFTLFCLILYSFVFSKMSSSANIMIFFAFGYFSLGAIIYKMLMKDYTKEFKEKVIHPLVKELDSNLNYESKQHLSQKYFRDSKLFNSTIDRYSGNDLVHGKIDDVHIEFSDIHAEKRHKSSKGKESWTTVFKGLFIVADFHKHFKGSTVVLPDSAQSTFGDLIGGWLQSKNFSREELVKMDHPEFETEFVVYASDQIEARYILSHSLMQKLLHFKIRSKHPLHISFVGQSINLAIEYNKDLFEPSVFRSLLDYKIAMEYVQTLHLCIGIVEELKLNQKLWSKQ